MKRYITLVVALLILVVAFALRHHDLEYRAPFDWDQDRDYSQVERITQGETVVLGPVAKGVGGFYLGSLYYYVLFPAYTLMHHDPLSLPMTSVILDTIMSVAIFAYLGSIIGRRKALILSLLWTFSWYTIDASQVSWNVALVPLWSLGLLISTYSVVVKRDKKYLYLLALLFGLSFHIHVAAIPLVPIFWLLYARSMRFSLREYVVAIVLAILPIMPLVLFDITHHYQNLHLLAFQFRSLGGAELRFVPMLSMVMIKLGKVVSGLIIASYRDNMMLGYCSIIVAILATRRSNQLIIRLSGTLLITSTLLIFALHDYGFPEYYYAPAYLAILILFVWMLYIVAHFLRSGRALVIVGVVAYILMHNYSVYKLSSPRGFSLGVKRKLVSSLIEIPGPLDIHYDLDPGRDGGLRYLVDLAGIDQDSSAKNRVIITDKVEYPAYIDGELASDQYFVGGLKSSLYIVQ